MISVNIIIIENVIVCMQTDSLGVQAFFVCKSIRGACHKTIMSQRMDAQPYISEALLETS